MTKETPSKQLANLMANYGLNHKQARFAILLYGGFTQTEAYAHVYNHGEQPEYRSRKYFTLAGSASKLVKTPKMQKALGALNAGEETIAAMSRAEKRGILATMARGQMPEIKPVDRARAIREDNLMQNEHNVDADVDDATGGNRKLLIEMVVKAQGS